MKRTAVTSFFIVFTLLSNIYASEKFISGGVNLSQFYDEISKPLPGYSLGFGWEWEIGGSSALLFRPTFLYRGTKLENKKIWTGWYLFTENIWCRRGYLDLPLLYRYYFSNHKVYLSAGLSLSLAIYDNSRDQVLDEKYYSAGYLGPYDYGGGPVDKLVYDSSIDAIFEVGTRLNNNNLTIGRLIHMAYGEIETIDSIGNINGSFITFSVLVSWYF